MLKDLSKKVVEKYPAWGCNTSHEEWIFSTGSCETIYSLYIAEPETSAPGGYYTTSNVLELLTFINWLCQAELASASEERNK